MATPDQLLPRPTAPRSELVVEHLGFFPLSFVDDVFNMVNDLVYQATAELERFIEAEQGGGEETEQGIHQFETLLESAVDKNFDLFELYVLRNTFAIREDVDLVLNYHEFGADAYSASIPIHGLDFSASQEDEDELDLKLNDVRRKVIALKNEIVTTDRRIERLEKCKQQIEFLTSMTKGKDVSPIDDTLSFVTDQVMALKTLLTSVRGEVDTGALFDGLQRSDDARTAYINEMVARQVEARGRGREAAAAGAKQAEGEKGVGAVDVERELKEVVERIGSVQDWQV
ncbi:Mis12 protein-domain-containing protein, partial [Jimgerdemannia flammicorona]